MGRAGWDGFGGGGGGGSTDSLLVVDCSLTKMAINSRRTDMRKDDFFQEICTRIRKPKLDADLAINSANLDDPMRCSNEMYLGDSNKIIIRLSTAFLRGG